MALVRITSPHAHGPMSTSRVMLSVLLATVPGVIVLTHFFGFGTIVNIAFGCLVAIACESAALKLRGRPLGFYLKDYSALPPSHTPTIAMIYKYCCDHGDLDPTPQYGDKQWANWRQQIAR